MTDAYSEGFDAGYIQATMDEEAKYEGILEEKEREIDRLSARCTKLIDEINRSYYEDEHDEWERDYRRMV